MTEEQQKDIKERAEAFLKEYGELVKKHQIDLATFPQYVQHPDGKGTFLTVVTPTTVDLKYQAQPSPFIDKDK